MWDSALVVGRTPGPGPEGTPAPPSRCPVEESSPSIAQQAGQGAGGPKGHPEGVRPTNYAGVRL
jgi:hypothetical protein